MRCLTYCLCCQDIWKAETHQIYALEIYWSSSSSSLVEDSNNVKTILQTNMQYAEKLGDYYYLIYLLSNCSSLDLHTVI